MINSLLDAETPGTRVRVKACKISRDRSSIKHAPFLLNMNYDQAQAEYSKTKYYLGKFAEYNLLGALESLVKGLDRMLEI